MRRTLRSIATPASPWLTRRSGRLRLHIERGTRDQGPSPSHLGDAKQFSAESIGLEVLIGPDSYQIRRYGGVRPGPRHM